MVWIIGLLIFVAAICTGLLWSKRQRQRELEAALQPITVSEGATRGPGPWGRSLSRMGSGLSHPRPVVLVASFDDDRALKRASEALQAADFTSNDYVCIYQNRNVAAAFAYKLRFAWAPQSVASVEACRDSVARIRDLIFSGCPMVIVRSTPRFAKACEIIETTGGRLGCGRRR